MGDELFGRTARRNVRRICLTAFVFAGLLISISAFSVMYFFGETDATGMCESHTLTLYTESGEGTITVRDENGALIGEETVSSSTTSINFCVEDGDYYIGNGENFRKSGGVVFAGWGTESGGGVVYNEGKAVNVSGDTDLYASWQTPTMLDSSFTGGYLTSGSYCLADNINLMSSITVAENARVTLYLNGYVMSVSSASARAINVEGTNKVFVLNDNCGTNYNSTPYHAYTVVDDLATLGSSYETATDAGDTYYYGGVISSGGVKVNSFASFTMNSGTISGSAKDDGAGIYAANSASLTMNGGTVSGNKAEYFGGGIYVTSNIRLTMNGGTVSDNTSTYGGGIYVDYSSRFTMNGGTVSGNKTSHGGGVYICGSGSSFTMNDGTISENKTVGGNGGGVYIESNASFTMNSGTISGNTAASRGGGVYMDDFGSSFTMNGGTISGNTTNIGGGGGVYTYGASFIMSGGTISGNLVRNSDGGGVFVTGSDASFTMGGGTISGNTAGRSGGGIYITISASFTMNNGIISNNTAMDGGGVFVTGSGVSFTMNNGTISGNTTRSSGGGVVVYDSASFTMNGGTISENTTGGVDGVGGVSVYNTSTLSLSGDAEIISNEFSNIYLSVGAKINVSDTLTSSTPSIGVTLAPGYNGAGGVTNADFTNNYSTYNAGVSPDHYFFSDNTDYGVAWNSGITEAVLGEKIVAPTITVEFGDEDANYVKGDVVPITVNVTNNASYDLSDVKLSLKLSAPNTADLATGYAFTEADGVVVSGTDADSVATIAIISAGDTFTVNGTYTIPVDPLEDEIITSIVEVIDATAPGYYFASGYSNATAEDATTVYHIENEENPATNSSSVRAYLIIGASAMMGMATIAVATRRWNRR